jgi:hypothetical protein
MLYDRSRSRDGDAENAEKEMLGIPAGRGLPKR